MTPPDLKSRYTIYISAIPFSEMSGGIRSLYILCDALNRGGFRAYTVGGGNAPRELDSPEAPPANLRSDVAGGRAIAVYPALVAGNPWRAPNVVRFLLNKPGVAGPDTSAFFGPRDYFVAFDKAHVPLGRSSFDLYVPLIDHRHYYPRDASATRSGFVMCVRRPPRAPLDIPQWAKPVTVVTPAQPRTHEELGAIYRSARAFIAYERTTAIYEALACSCPVLCISSDLFNEASYQVRFGGAGLSWGSDEASLEGAASTVGRFAEIYREIETDFPQRAEAVFLEILQRVTTGRR